MKLTLDSSDFKTNLKQCNEQIKNLESQLKLAKQEANESGNSLTSMAKQAQLYDNTIQVLTAKQGIFTSRLEKLNEEYEIYKEQGLLTQEMESKHILSVNKLETQINNIQTKILSYSQAQKQLVTSGVQLSETYSEQSEEIEGLLEKQKELLSQLNEQEKAKFADKDTLEQIDKAVALQEKIKNLEKELDVARKSGASKVFTDDSSHKYCENLIQIASKTEAIKQLQKEISNAEEWNPKKVETYANQLERVKDDITDLENENKTLSPPIDIDKADDVLSAYKEELESLKSITGIDELDSQIEKVKQTISELESKAEELPDMFEASGESIDILTSKLKAEESAIKSSIKSGESYESSLEKINSAISTSQQLEKEYEKQLQQVEEQYGNNTQEYYEAVESLEKQKTKTTSLISEKENLIDIIEKEKQAIEETVDTTNKLESETKEVSRTQITMWQEWEGAIERYNAALDSLVSAITSKLKSAWSTASSYAVEFVEDALDAYSEFESYGNGIEKLYGDDYIDVVENATEASKKAGISTTDYMKNITSFSARLISALDGDTEEAAAQADKAINAAADNARTFGTEISDITTVYKALARQQYTTLDNLQLGYAGTKEGAEEMIADANEYLISIGQTGDLVVDNFADVIDAIVIAQEQLGIAGSAQNQNTETVKGSLDVLKTSWENFTLAVTQGTSEANSSLDDVKSNLQTYIDNIMPALQTSLKSIMSVAANNLPGIAKYLNQVKNISKALKGEIEDIDGFVSKIKKLVSKIALITTSVIALGKVISAVVTTVMAVAKAKAITSALTGVAKTVTALATGISSGMVGAIIAAVAAIAALVAAYIQWKKANDEVYQSVQATNDAIETSNYNLSEISDNLNDSYTSLMAQVSITKQYQDRLELLCDSQGKIKAGYEDEAQTILDKLNAAYNTNYTIVDGKIQNYDDLIKKSDEYIKQMKKEAIVEAFESQYVAAFSNSVQMNDKYNNALSDFEAFKEGLSEEQIEILENQDEFEKEFLQLDAKLMTGSFTTDDELERYKTISNTFCNYKDDYNDYATAYEAATDAMIEANGKLHIIEQGMQSTTWEEASQALKDMQDETAVYSAGITQLEENIVEQWENGEISSAEGAEAIRRIFEDNADELNSDEKYTLYKLFKKLQKGIKSALGGGDDPDPDGEEAGSNTVTSYTNAIKSTIESESDSTLKSCEDFSSNVFKALTGKDYSQDYYDAAVETGEYTGQGLNDGMANKQDQLVTTATNIGEAITGDNSGGGAFNDSMGINSPSKYTYKTGTYVMQGLINGLQSKKTVLSSKAYEIGQNIISQINLGAGVQSPSKYTRLTGMYIGEGLKLGISDEENKVVKQAQQLANKAVNVISGIDRKANLNGNLNLSREITLTNELQAEMIMDALQGVEVTMDGQNMGRFVTKSVLNKYRMG